ncbi:ABC transporter permease [Apilactobacillus kunkeei]|uniref:ABC transporter permease n=1 Tax=Apilactobacillus kunkeei TaxID=148814 RepID=UPI0006C3CD65|nr:ABC transporter permease [Apilactobacillus kunkeei]KOY70597.1 hypothetical protein RZ55_13590 [Apilactobacillus kunkeei]
MTSLINSEFLKIRRTSIPWLTILVPFFCVFLVAVVFAGNEYSMQSIINQWSLIWVLLFSVLLSGMTTHHESISTQYKSILSSPVSLFKFELSRLIMLVELFFIGNVFLAILVCISKYYFSSMVGMGYILLSIIMVSISGLWTVPFFLLISRLSNMFVGILIGLFGFLIGGVFSGTRFGYLIPFTWSPETASPIIKMHVNGVPYSLGTHSFMNTTYIILSLSLFIVLTLTECLLFTRQEVKK